MAYAADRRGLTTLDIRDLEREDYKRRLREAQEAESGPVTETIDLSVFEPIRPGTSGPRRRAPAVKLNRTGVALTPAADELLGRPARIEVRVAPRALAFIAAPEGDDGAFRPVRKRKGGETYAGATIGSPRLRAILAERGWPMGELIPLRHYPEQRALVAVLPRGREGGA